MDSWRVFDAPWRSAGSTRLWLHPGYKLDQAAAEGRSGAVSRQAGSAETRENQSRT
jgi:hypothetical protein